jgi:uncharacterized protein YbcI
MPAMPSTSSEAPFPAAAAGPARPSLASRSPRARRPCGRAVGRLVAHAVADFEQRLLGRSPRHVTVTVGAGLIVVSLQQQLAPIEREVAADPAGSSRVQNFHQDLFADSRSAFREHVAALTGIDLAAGVLDIDLETGCLLKTFSTGPAIDLYLFGPPAPLLGLPIDWHVHAEAVRRQAVRQTTHATDTTEVGGRGAPRDCLQSRRTVNHEEVTHVGTDTKESGERDHRASRGSGSNARNHRP